MVKTRSTSTSENPFAADPLAAIAVRLDALDELTEKVNALEANASHQSRSRERFRHNNGSDDEPNGFRHRFRRSHAKIDFPTFSGGDPRGWVLKAEKYFRLYDTPEEDKVEVASMHLDGDALDLFSWVSARRSTLYWDELVKILQEHYGPPEFQNSDEHLCNIKQIGTVHEYRQEWARRVARVSDWPDHCLLGVFLNGLKEELKTDVRIHKPRTVFQATSLALEYERKAATVRGNRSGIAYTHTRPDSPSYSSSHMYRENRGVAATTYGVGKMTPTLAPSPTSSATFSNSSKNSFNDPERQRRRDKGLCFRCGETFRPGHRCTGSFSLMEIDENGNPVADSLDTLEESDHEKTENTEVSFNAILGQPSAATMKLSGTLGSKRVLLLVGSGSTHNFISDSLIRELSLPTCTISTFGVRIGDGSVIKCNQICRNVEVKLPGLTITQDFYPFSLVGSNLVLGIKWLAFLNTVQANWNDMYMIFWVEGKRYKLQGVTP